MYKVPNRDKVLQIPNYNTLKMKHKVLLVLLKQTMPCLLKQTMPCLLKQTMPCILKQTMPYLLKLTMPLILTVANIVIKVLLHIIDGKYMRYHILKKCHFLVRVVISKQELCIIWRNMKLLHMIKGKDTKIIRWL